MRKIVRKASAKVRTWFNFTPKKLENGWKIKGLQAKYDKQYELYKAMKLIQQEIAAAINQAATTKGVTEQGVTRLAVSFTYPGTIGLKKVADTVKEKSGTVELDDLADNMPEPEDAEDTDEVSFG